MKIGFVIRHLDDEKSVISRLSLILSDELKNQGEEVFILSETKGHDFYFNLNRFTMPLYLLFAPYILLKMRKFDVILISTISTPSAYFSLLKRIGLLKKPIAVISFGSDVREQEMLGIRLLNRVSKYIDALIVINPDLVDIAKEIGYKNVKYIANWGTVDFKRENKVHISRKKYALDGEKIVLFAGRLDTFKDPLTFVEGANLLIKRGERGNTFLIAGEGSLSGEIKAYIDKRGIEEKVKMLGWVSHEEVQSLMNIADIAVQLSPVENIWAAVLIEAMAHKKAIICTNAGKTAEFLKDGGEVLLIEPRDPEKLAQKIALLSENEDLRRKLGQNAFDYAKRNFDVKEIGKEIREMLERLWSAKRSVNDDKTHQEAEK
jgi:glycosyltransferase involved in cell wall biosynthesis